MIYNRIIVKWIDGFYRTIHVYSSIIGDYWWIILLTDGFHHPYRSWEYRLSSIFIQFSSVFDRWFPHGKHPIHSSSDYHPIVIDHCYRMEITIITW